MSEPHDVPADQEIETTTPPRYQCVLDLTAYPSKERVILHVPQNMFVRLCKATSEDPASKDIHMYVGKKRASSKGSLAGFTVVHNLVKRSASHNNIGSSINTHPT